MDNRLKSILENYDSMKIGLDDTFRFHCKMCGKCCTNREDIILNPHDLYRLAKELDKEPFEVLSEYCDTYIGVSSKMVIVRLLPRGSAKRCPLLRGQKCSVHKAKPTVCALYPLGRSLGGPTNALNSIENAEIQYILQPASCGDDSETHTVREWLKDFDLLTEEAFFKKWMRIAVDYGKVIRKAEETFSEEVFNKLATSILCLVYLNYVTSEPFMPQFEQNNREMRELFSALSL